MTIYFIIIIIIIMSNGSFMAMHIPFVFLSIIIIIKKVLLTSWVKVRLIYPKYKTVLINKMITGLENQTRNTVTATQR